MSTCYSSVIPVFCLQISIKTNITSCFYEAKQQWIFFGPIKYLPVDPTVECLIQAGHPCIENFIYNSKLGSKCLRHNTMCCVTNNVLPITQTDDKHEATF